MPIIYRSSRPAGEANGLTNAEIDGNFAFLEQGKEEAGVAATLLNQHTALSDPHPQYTTAAEAAGAAPVQSVAGKTGAVTLVKADVGLANVDNTSDANKPVSTAQSAAIATAISTHEAAADPHPQYTTAAEAATALATKQDKIGVPSAFTSRTLTNADDGDTLVCASAQTATVNAGLVSGFGAAFKGAISFTAGAGVTITDLRSTGATVIWCSLVQTGTDTYDVLGGRA